MFGQSKKVKELEELNARLRRKVDEQAKELEIFSKFQDAFPISFFAIDPQKKILTFNREFVNITGFSENEIRNSAGASLILWPVNPSECKVCKLAMQYVQEKRSGDGTAYITTKRGEEVPVYVYVVPIIENGTVVRTYILLRDQRNEIRSRKEYMQKESQPIIDTLQNIANGVLDKPLQLDDQSELKILEKPVNDIRENIQNITEQITTSTNKILQMTTNSVDSLGTTTSIIEDLTNKISKNTQEIAHMSSNTDSVMNSLQTEVDLANKTVSSMDQINEQVNLITDSISVIDQIAFQTNILSLNAAVEAATAGEAGKGFAVVAQEVRNLATRSAEAAKDIKDIVETATSKANEGKTISSKMIEGFASLNESIKSMADVISKVTQSSTEQQRNMQEINQSIQELASQIQQSANVTNDSKEQTFKILHIKD